ncbi:hypothetical protein [Paenibacillus sp. GYB003]|jgi:hypothetical protein|uniref:hypothetical protein n=1 Tax=Paenibacillus sp. GYB003 TaxID=2994392 RepID=UPI002F969F0D
MSPKQFILVGTMALVISIGSVLQDDKTYAQSDICPLGSKTLGASALDEFRQALGVASDEEVHDALYSGRSLADIAAANDKDVQPVIELQIAQLKEQLDSRYASGSITLQQYESHKAELREIVTDSAYGRH